MMRVNKLFKLHIVCEYCTVMDMKLYKLFFNQAVTLKSELGWNEEIPNSTVKNIDLIEILCNSKQLKQHWFYIM